MERAGRQAVRVLGIVGLSGLLLISCGIFALLAALGLFSERVDMFMPRLASKC